MSNSIVTVSPVVVTPLTPQQQMVLRATSLAKQQASAVQQVVNIFQLTAQFIWQDPTKAQAKFDAFTAAGYKATDLFVNAEAYIAFVTVLNGAAPASAVPTGYSYTLNADGTVTVIPPASSEKTTK